MARRSILMHLAWCVKSAFLQPLSERDTAPQIIILASMRIVLITCASSVPLSNMRGTTVNSNTNPVTVLIVDDHLQFRKALRQALEIEDDIQVVGEADDWHTLVQGLHSSHPDVVLMDLNMRFSGEI